MNLEMYNLVYLDRMQNFEKVRTEHKESIKTKVFEEKRRLCVVMKLRMENCFH
jgi:hypothetical protein